MEFIKQRYPLLLSIWIAFVFVQSLFFKFTGAPETEHIFGVLADLFGVAGINPYGAYVVGSLELIASILLFTRWWAWGALLAFEIMSGAIVFHLFTPLGIVMPAFDSLGVVIGDDGGTLFVMACLTWLSSVALVVKDVTAKESGLRAFIKK
ncbi:hypothetical protein [Teredinibacter sp. KSP-S5-2]|uniref:hypothetical protein n=1 Tax=Teredinibacter sp. KSP-S5-2 TaxID=3034506 RepID=UPI002934D56A|nr:hypothetical protein [Teredinibacter sp. KSP-S5-2]WNO10109.1 hypothetical protein P5V12_02885 [Teredinibacter sp. KSP-S5-2]